MIWALKENKQNHSREKKPGGLIEIWRWCHPGREEGGFWVENSLWEGGACSVVQGTQGKASAGALQTKARYCFRGQPSTAQSLVSWDGGSVFYMKCSEKSAEDWTFPCLDVWFHGWWIKITPRTWKGKRNGRKRKETASQPHGWPGCSSTVYPTRQGRMLRAQMECQRAHSFAFRDPPSFISLTAGEDDKLLCPTELYWFGTQHWIEKDWLILLLQEIISSWKATLY